MMTLVLCRSLRLWLLAMGLMLTPLPVLAEEAPAEGGPPVQMPADHVPHPEKAALLGIDRLGDRLVAVGMRGIIIVSTDGGATWTQAEVPVQRTLTDVFIANERDIWVIGHDALVLYSGDGGNSWDIRFAAPELDVPLLDIVFFGDSEGQAIGANGLFITTQDGGQTWQDRIVPVEEGLEYHLYGLAAFDRQTLMIAAEAGYLLRSTDGGETWQAVSSPYIGSFFGILALDAKTVLAYGMRGNVFVSRDRGETWEKIETGIDESFMSGKPLPDGGVLLVGAGGTVARIDPALTRSTDLSRPDRVSLADAVALDDGSVVFVGLAGVAVQTALDQ